MTTHAFEFGNLVKNKLNNKIYFVLKCEGDDTRVTLWKNNKSWGTHYNKKTSDFEIYTNA